MPTSGESLTSTDVLVIGLGVTGAIALRAARDVGVDARGIDLVHESPEGTLDGCNYSTRAWGIFADGTVACASTGWSRRFQAKALIIATGGIDLPLPLPGWELPGAIGAHRAERSLDDGVEVAVIRGPHAGLGGHKPNLERFTVVIDHDLASGDPVSITGDGVVQSLTIGGTTTSVSHVLLDNGLQPENVLARMTGVPSEFSVQAGGDAIVPGSVFAGTGALITVIGDAAGISSDDEVTRAAARDAGRLLAESVAGGRIPVAIPEQRPAWQPGGAPVLPTQATGDTLVCPDEGITVAMVRDAIDRGATTVNDVKRRTRAAMAACQGRDCLWTIRAMLAEAGRAYTTPMTARPPAAGITVGELAAIHAE
ncbi:MAG TPA: (2Fe-2S)-binding protein [Thermomicrobiales bacterium]|nr:(2Fe-2S)-binding protein [Thermomicrobiales bacterium]